MGSEKRGNRTGLIDKKNHTYRDGPCAACGDFDECWRKKHRVQDFLLATARKIEFCIPVPGSTTTRVALGWDAFAGYWYLGVEDFDGAMVVPQGFASHSHSFKPRQGSFVLLHRCKQPFPFDDIPKEVWEQTEALVNDLSKLAKKR